MYEVTVAHGAGKGKVMWSGSKSLACENLQKSRGKVVLRNKQLRFGFTLNF